MQVSRKAVWTIMGLVVLGSVVFLTKPADEPVSTRRTTTKTTVKTDENFTKADYEATFQRVALTARNPFIPLVSSSRGKGQGPMGIPASLAGGDPNWVFTGMAEIDRVPVALLENKSTMDGVFLKHGEIWNGSRVVAISPDELILAGEDGIKRKVSATFGEEPAKTVVTTTSEVRPLAVDPNLRGPIGGVNVEPAAPTNRRGRRAQSGTPESMANGVGQGVTSAIPNIQ